MGDAVKKLLDEVKKEVTEQVTKEVTEQVTKEVTDKIGKQVKEEEAIKMIVKGYQTEEISDITGLLIEEVKRLRSKAKQE